jgi:hypothetical protein
MKSPTPPVAVPQPIQNVLSFLDAIPDPEARMEELLAWLALMQSLGG